MNEFKEKVDAITVQQFKNKKELAAFLEQHHGENWLKKPEYEESLYFLDDYLINDKDQLLEIPYRGAVLYENVDSFVALYDDELEDEPDVREFAFKQFLNNPSDIPLLLEKENARFSNKLLDEENRLTFLDSWIRRHFDEATEEPNFSVLVTVLGETLRTHHYPNATWDVVPYQPVNLSDEEDVLFYLPVLMVNDERYDFSFGLYKQLVDPEYGVSKLMTREYELLKNERFFQLSNLNTYQGTFYPER